MNGKPRQPELIVYQWGADKVHNMVALLLKAVDEDTDIRVTLLFCSLVVCSSLEVGRGRIEFHVTYYIILNSKSNTFYISL